MKIAYIILKGMPFTGGIEKYTEEVGQRLAFRGHTITVYTMKHYGSQDGIFKGMKIKTVSTWENKHFEKLVSTFLATLKLMTDAKVDICHYHAFGPSMFCFFPRIMGIKVLVQGHGLEWKRSRWGPLGRLFLRFSEIPSIAFPNALTVVSKNQQDYIKNKYGRYSHYIPTGVNPPHREIPDLIKRYGLQGNDYILFAARLVREKGASTLIKAYNRLKTDFKLVIAGDAPYEDDYKSELRNLAAGNENIIFTGFVLGRLYQELFSNCYLFVLPSEIEGLSTTLLEAMSYGNCCLASDISENVEALNDFGYYYRNKNVNDFADKLTFLINNPEAVQKVKNRAHNYIMNNYSWDNITDRFEELYSRLMSQ